MWATKTPKKKKHEHVLRFPIIMVNDVKWLAASEPNDIQLKFLNMLFLDGSNPLKISQGRIGLDCALYRWDHYMYQIIDMCHDLNGSSALEHWTQAAPIRGRVKSLKLKSGSSRSRFLKTLNSSISTIKA